MCSMACDLVKVLGWLTGRPRLLQCPTLSTKPYVAIYLGVMPQSSDVLVCLVQETTVEWACLFRQPDCLYMDLMTL